MPHIIPITDLRDTNKITELCATNEPVFVTKNGYGSLVLMSMQSYEEQQEQLMLQELLTKIDINKASDGDTVMKRLKEKYVDKKI